MKKIFLFISLAFSLAAFAQKEVSGDSSEVGEQDLENIIRANMEQQMKDSLERLRLTVELNNTRLESEQQRNELMKRLSEIEKRDSLSNTHLQNKVDSIKESSVACAVAPFKDTLFYIYTKLGSLRSKERASNAERKIKSLYDDDFLNIDSVVIQHSEYSTDIVYRDLIIHSVSELDGLLSNKKNGTELAGEYLIVIKTAIQKEREANSLWKILYRIGLVILITAFMIFLIKMINRLYRYSIRLLIRQKERLLTDVQIKDYTLFSGRQKARIFAHAINIVRWLIIVVLLFLMLPMVFSVFPFTQSWAENLIKLVTSPLKKAVLAVWNYIPNLITILVIFFFMRYFIRLIRYVFSEIDKGNLKINGFDKDFAMPTFSIVRFLLQVFLLILIFPYLPGSDSNIFQGVSVFVGILFSLGSSSAIANIVAGLVITYMKPFRVGDRISIADKTGVVIEKSLLVTRLKTVRNEEITIPNSAILSGNTINYSTFSEKGILIPIPVSVGYEVPWEEAHRVMLEACSYVPKVRKSPAPFVFQKKLDDFYVLYELNVYIDYSGDTDYVISDVYKSLQNAFRKENIDMRSPHFYTKVDDEEKK